MNEGGEGRWSRSFRQVVQKRGVPIKQWGWRNTSIYIECKQWQLKGNVQTVPLLFADHGSKSFPLDHTNWLLMYSLPLQTHLHQNVQDLLLLVPSSAPKFFSSENSNRALQVRGNVTYNKGRQEKLSRIRVFKTSSAGVKGATPPNHSVDFPNTQ